MKSSNSYWLSRKTFEKKYSQVQSSANLGVRKTAIALADLQDQALDHLWALCDDEVSFTKTFGMLNTLVV